ncbi:MAG: ABC1 kinase family protein [Sandaracinaceae bacterium]
MTRLDRAARLVSGALEEAVLAYVPLLGAIERDHVRTALDGLRQTRGLPIKLAQMLHEMPELVPEVVRTRLGAAYEGAPAVGWPTVRSTIERELGGRVEDLFDHIEHTPLAVASLGQVHAARFRDAPVAVKVQHPDLECAVGDDLALLRGAMRVTAWARPFQGIVDELALRLGEELDYREEAKNLDWFRTALAPLEVEVPRPYFERSSQRVLTMSRLSGESFARWLANEPPVDARQRIAERLMRAYAAMIGDLRRIHADPSPGNVYVLASSELGLLDLGSTRWLSRPVSGLVAGLWARPDSASTEEVALVFESLGLLDPGDRETFEEHVVPLAKWFAGPHEHPDAPFDFTQGGWAASGRERLRRLLHDGARLGVHVEFVLLFRAVHGLFNLLDALRVEVPASSVEARRSHP